MKVVIVSLLCLLLLSCADGKRAPDVGSGAGSSE